MSIVVIEDDANNVLITTELLRMIGRIRIGLHTDEPEPFMGPVINAAAAERLLAAQADLVSRGAHPLVELRPLRGIANLLMPALIDVTHVKDRPDEEPTRHRAEPDPPL